jgi:hypothetical protein
MSPTEFRDCVDQLIDQELKDGEGLQSHVEKNAD